MKTLLLIRHAKSSWKDRSLSDHDRPLNKRGERNRWQVADALGQYDIRLDQLYSSTALRARLMGEAIAPVLIRREQPLLDPALYTFDSAMLWRWLSAREEALQQIGLVAHNPALTELAQQLAPEPLDNLPTGAILGLQLDITRWQACQSKCGKRLFLLCPRDL